MTLIVDPSAAEGPTLSELITEVTAAAQGDGLAPDRVLALSDAITTGSLSFVAPGAGGPGVYEIDTELVYVSTVDASTGSCTVHPSGRGWQGTTAAAHDAGSIVVETPVYPRSRIAKAINDVISGAYPVIFAVGSTETTVTQDMIELPDEAQDVLEVRTLIDEDWVRVRSWEAELHSGSVTTTKAVLVPGITVGNSIQVLYSLRPVRLTTDAQAWSTTGLSIGMKDVVVLGALARYAQTLDVARLSDRFVGPRGDAQQPQLGTGMAIARQLKTDYQAALDREAGALRRLYPARAHFTR